MTRTTLILVTFVMATGCGDSAIPTSLTSPTSPTPAVDPTPQLVIERGVADYIEALFLGLGPLSPTDGNSGCPDGQYGYWIGWENSNLRVTVSDVVDSAAKRLVERAAAQVSEATAGRYSATYSQTGATNPIPGHGEGNPYRTS